MIKKVDMPVATSAASSATNSSTQQMMHQSQSGSAMLSSSGMSSIPPRGNKKCPPSPTPNFNARSLPKGKSYHIYFWIIIAFSILTRV